MNSKPCLTLDICRKISAAAEAEAKKNKLNVSLAIVDDGGHVLLVLRMDGASPATVEIAMLKARSAAVTRRSTKVTEDLIAGGRVSLLKMPALPVQGGLPIMYEGQCVGGIGASGAQSSEDELVCTAGIAKLE